MLRSQFKFSVPLQYSTEPAVKIKASILREKTCNDSSKVAKSKHVPKRVNYLDLSSHYSKAIDFRQRPEKRGRLKKPKSVLKRENRKRRKRKEAYCQTECKTSNNQEEVVEPEVGQLPDVQATTRVTVIDKEEWEKRKKSIKAKLFLKRENLLTKDEEQDIHMRADVYAITTIPDASFYVLPEYDSMPRAPMRVEEITIDTTYPAIRKKRRRNYGSANCYINEHNEEDIFDNTRMLPIGTRLIKPPNKLVELVAQAVDGSPDGLLQVQQIYTYLQNRYPYFRYMERGAINSWRSSIRHALYQKWFRKIRFDLSYISCKGCYWTINHKSTPREWTLPSDTCHNLGPEETLLVDGFDFYGTTYRKVGTYLQDEQTVEENTDIISAAREYEAQVINSTCLTQNSSEEIDVENHIPSPVREPDPILATCAPDWLSDEFCYMPKPDSSSIDNLHPTSSTTPLLSPSLSSPAYSSPDDIGTDLQLGTPITSPVQQKLGILRSKDPKPRRKPKKKTPRSSDISDPQIVPDIFDPFANSHKNSQTILPVDSYKENWDNHETVILSPNSISSPRMYVFGCPPLLQNADALADITEDIDVLNADEYIECSEFYTPFHNISGVLESIENSSSETSGSDSGSFSDIDVIAEFTKSSGHSSPSDISTMIYGS